MPCEKSKEFPTLAMPMDTRSPAGSVGRNAWALVLNAQADLSGRMMRLGGWRRFGWQADDLGIFVNQDFHDQLDSAAVTDECLVPTEVRIEQTSTYADGSVGIGLSHNGAEPSRVRWYRDGVLIFDSNA